MDWDNKMILEIATTILGALILAFLGWIWRTSKILTILKRDIETIQADVERLRQETKDRYLSREAKQDFNDLRVEMVAQLQKMEDKLENRIERIEDRFRTEN